MAHTFWLLPTATCGKARETPPSLGGWGLPQAGFSPHIFVTTTWLSALFLRPALTQEGIEAAAPLGFRAENTHASTFATVLTFLVHLGPCRTALRPDVHSEILLYARVPRVIVQRAPFDPLLVAHRRAPVQKRLCIRSYGMP